VDLLLDLRSPTTPRPRGRPPGRRTLKKDTTISLPLTLEDYQKIEAQKTKESFQPGFTPKHLHEYLQERVQRSAKRRVTQPRRGPKVIVETMTKQEDMPWCKCCNRQSYVRFANPGRAGYGDFKYTYKCKFCGAKW
jgi:hypothetical protein